MSLRLLLREMYLRARGALIKLLVKSGPVASADYKLVRSILVIRTDRIGDVVVSLPAIKALKDIFPYAEISVLARESNAAILANLPFIAKVIPYVSFRRSIPVIRQLRFDMAVDLVMDYSLKTAAIAFAGGAGVRAGFDIASRGRFFNIPVTPDVREKNMSEHVLDIVRSVASVYKQEAASTWDTVPHIKVPEKAMASAEYILKINGIKKNDLILSFHPGGYFPSQRWIPEYFAELADRLREDYDAMILMIGGPEDEELIRKISSMMAVSPACIVGRPLDAVAALLASSRLLICNNSGLLHLAAAVGTPTVSTMGPTVPYLWRPAGARHKVVRHELDCSPCGKAFCRDHECMKRISVFEMERAAVALLDDAGHDEEVLPKATANKIAADKILVIDLGGIGDIILASPALRSLRAAYPNARISMLNVKRAHEFTSRLKYIDEPLYLDMDLSAASLAHNAKTLSYLKAQKIDMAVNMRTIVSRAGALKLRALLGIIAPRTTAGRDTDGLGSFLDVRIPESRIGQKSETEYDLDTVMALGADIIDRRPDLPKDDAAERKIEEMLSRYRSLSQSEALIGVHPGGKPSHRWPAGRFAEVINAISGKTKAKFVITGDADDTESAKAIMRLSGADIIDSTGKLTVAELTALIGRCNLYISNDTAAMHIAAVLKVPLIAIFGPGYIKRFDPRNISKDAVVMYRPAACSPCDRSVCDRPVCLDAVSSDEVSSRAFRLLGLKEGS